MRETAIREQQEQMSGVFSLGRNVGVALMANIVKNFSAAAEVRAFEEINKSKDFKGLPIRHPDGVLRPAENIDEFCRVVFGRGYKAMNNHKVILQKLGEEAYENATRLSLNRSQLRLLLSLPEDDRAIVEEAMRTEDKTEVVGLLESLVNKLDEARAEVEELKGELKATEELSSEKSRKIERLEIDKRRFQMLPPDEVLAALHNEATKFHNEACGIIRGMLRQAVIAVDRHHQEHGGDSKIFFAGLIGQIQADLTELRDEYGIPDAHPLTIPEWIRDGAEGEATNNMAGPAAVGSEPAGSE
ncbi:hypothetical protein CDA09_22395 [Azoarcus sp. DN11]|nr:hypothetical protein CDA09_22395 [Azoarcus sp. DN11]